MLCAGVLTFAACGSDDSSDESDGTTTITWWHNSNNEPGMGYYEQVAKDFEADHPGVKIEISAMAHEDMVDKLDAAFQSGDIPDIYMERGGGELADHVEAGLVRDLSDDAVGRDRARSAARSPAGRSTARPTRCRSPSASSGFWYNTDLFEQAGITDAADDDGRVVRRHREAQGRRTSPRSRSAPATSGRPRTTGTTRRCGPAPRTCSRTRSPASTSPTRASSRPARCSRTCWRPSRSTTAS